MHPLRSITAIERGSTTLAFSIAMPIVILIVFATIQFGLVMYHSVLIHTAAADAARVAAACTYRHGQPSCDDQTVARAKYLLHLGILPVYDDAVLGIRSAYDVTPNQNDCTIATCVGAERSEYSSVTVRANYPMSVPLVGTVSLRLSATSYAVREKLLPP